MKLYIFIFLVGSCTSYKLHPDEDESKGVDQFWIDDTTQSKYSPKELLDVILDVMQKSTPPAEANQRVFGGQPARPSSAPFLAGIMLTERDGKKFWCGGSLINIRYILTAAHCLDDPVNATVILGAYNRLNATEETRQTQIVAKKNFIVPDNWNDDTFRNDIALIKLNQNVRLTPQIQPIEVANSTFDAIDGLEAVVLGWGYFNTSSILSPYIQFILDNLIPNTICRETYGRLVRSTNVCLNGSSGRTACTGDDGGPLVILDSNGVLIQVGIASFGYEEGCDKFFPSVFTRVSKYYKWIQRNAKL